MLRFVPVLVALGAGFALRGICDQIGHRRPRHTPGFPPSERSEPSPAEAAAEKAAEKAAESPRKSAEAKREKEILDQQGEESFPASDPPANY
ncbi:hypothetical protein [Pontibaca methylaminivorans]|uniref:Uncharacterized protein n=1 Tax=Pontibaca methylaminivorans TaxID=515897 RepID=A0A1R3X7N6_9RHOB|nr:hypothetical protein [Pontibaca methylaminivorans]SIT86694.1 hypothetical protein SAMN05421849_2376 [Pontibaca methylaminivorans]